MVKKILVTGSTGFLGKNLIDVLEKSTDYEVLSTNSQTSKDELIEKIKTADFIAHLAGVTRATDPALFYEGNNELTNIIVTTLTEENKTTPIVFTSSIHATLDNDYGKSKRLSEDMLFLYEKEQKANVHVIRLTNTFGKWAKPNYHSVIATFCYNVSHNLEIFVSDPAKNIDLLYVDDVISCLMNIIENKPDTLLIKEGKFYKVGTVYPKTLGALASSVRSFPSRKESSPPTDEFEKKLFTTYLSYKD